MTVITILAFLALVYIIVFMAVDAPRLQLVLVNTSLVQIPLMAVFTG
jgi:hypothetical protein